MHPRAGNDFKWYQCHDTKNKAVYIKKEINENKKRFIMASLRIVLTQQDRLQLISFVDEYSVVRLEQTVANVVFFVCACYVRIAAKRCRYPGIECARTAQT